MKVLIQDYSSFYSTEPMYLDRCFNDTREVQSALWNINQISTFDVLDRFTPDVLICHGSSKILNDVFRYLQGSSNIELVINITGLNEMNISLLESIIEKHKFKCPFFINNYHEQLYQYKQQNIKMVNLLPAVDLFLNTPPVVDFNVEAGIISRSRKDLIEKECQKYKTHHKLRIEGNQSKDDFFDIPVNILNLTSLYNKYENIIIADDISFVFSQIFFDSTLKAKRTILRTDDDEKANKILASLFRDDESGDDIADIIKNQVKRKHSCLNRASKILRNLNNESAAQKLQKISESL